MTDLANAEQIRAIVEPTAKAAASAAIRDFVTQHPHFAPAAPKATIPPSVKWAGIVISALLTTGISGACFWVVSTLNDLQLTVTRIDERQQQDDSKARISALEKRVLVLEQEKGK